MHSIEAGDTWHTVAAKLLRASLDPDSLGVSEDPARLAQQATAAALLALRDELTATPPALWGATHGAVRVPCPACARYYVSHGNATRPPVACPGCGYLPSSAGADGLFLCQRCGTQHLSHRCPRCS